MSDTPARASDADTRVFPQGKAAGCPFAPPPGLRALQAEKPLTRVRIWDDSMPWLVTGHAEQRIVLSNPSVSADEKLPGFPHQGQGMAETLDERPPTIFNTDAPEHSRFRRLMTYPFTLKRVEALRPVIQKITDDLIDTMLAGPKPVDLVKALALPLPTLMISAMLGVPYTDHKFFQRHAAVAVDRYASPEVSRESGREMIEYLSRLIQASMDADTPDEGWVADIAERVKAGDCTVFEAAQMGIVLLIAGHETSANMIGLGTVALLQNPEQLAVFRDSYDPKVIAGAVEEMLRYLSIAQHGLRRIAKEDIEVGGEVIRAGEGIVVPLPIANWDPQVFPEPEQLDLSRQARQHHAFGFGIHQCVGQQLARAELQIVYGTLYKRIPTMKLATTPDKLNFKYDSFAFGVHEVPITW